MVRGARTRPSHLIGNIGAVTAAPMSPDPGPDPDPDPELVYAVVDGSSVRDPQLREQLLEMWVDVTNAGGAVGFTVPADVSAIANTLDDSLARVADGRDLLGVLRQDGAAVGMGFLVEGGSALRRH